jgi:hypothetical protein
MLKRNQLSYYVAVSDLKKILKKIDELRKLDRAKRSIGFSMLAVTKERIFENGKDGKNTDIGDYSDKYMKIREKNKWPSSTKVILQAKRNLIREWTLIVDNNRWGLGFINDQYYKIAEGLEARYKKDIFAHTDAEVNQFTTLFENEVNRILNAN